MINYLLLKIDNRIVAYLNLVFIVLLTSLVGGVRVIVPEM